MVLESLDEMMRNLATVENMFSVGTGIALGGITAVKDHIAATLNKSRGIVPSSETVPINCMGVSVSWITPYLNSTYNDSPATIPILRSIAVYEASFWATYYASRYAASYVTRKLANLKK